MMRRRFPLAGLLLLLPLVANGWQGQPAASKDQFGDPLPPGAVARLGSLRWRHDGGASFAAFLPDGKSVISAGEDQTVRVWEYPSGKELRRMVPSPRANKGRVFFGGSYGTSAALSKDGKTVAACFNGQDIYLFDVATGKELPGLEIDMAGGVNRRFGLICALAFAPTGDQLASLDDAGTARLWDWGNAKQIREFNGQAANFVGGFGDNALVWAPDGKAVATVHLEINVNRVVSIIKLWDPATGNEIRTITTGDEAFAPSAVISPDGKMLAIATFDGAINLIDVTTGREMRKLVGDRFNFSSLIFSKDGTKLYSRAFGNVIAQEWDVATGRALRKITSNSQDSQNVLYLNYGRSAGSMSLSPDGNILLVSGFSYLPQFLDLAAGKEINAVEGHTGPVLSVNFSPDGKHLTTQGSDLSMRKWDAVTGKDLRTVAMPNPSSVNAVSPDGQVLAVWSRGAKGGLTMLAAATRKELGKVQFKTTETVAIRFSPDGKILAVRQRQEQKIDLYEVPSAKLLHTIGVATGYRKPGGPVAKGATVLAPQTMIFSPDGKYLASYSDPSTMGLWDTATAKTIAALPMPGNGIQSGSFSPDGRCLALDMNDGFVRLYEVATAKPRRIYGKKPDLPRKDSNLFPVVRVSSNDPQAGSRVAFSPDGMSLVQAAPDQVVYWWDLATSQQLASFKGHTGPINAVAFSASGTRVASASFDTTVLVWDAASVARPAVPGKALKAHDLDACWADLASDDASKAFTAICNLTCAPKDAVAFLKEHVKPTVQVDGQRIVDLIAQLEDAQFKVRQKASAELFKIGEQIVPAIDKVLAKDPPPETRNRLEDLRRKLTGLILKGERLRVYRAVEVLERLDTPEARDILQALADGAPNTLLTTSAQGSLKRLGQKTGP